MLGAGHFKKKIDKKNRKKEAKKATSGSSRGGQQQQKQPFQSSSSSDQKAKKKDGSFLKGPVVSHAGGLASRDSANNKKNIPFSSKMEEFVYRKEHRVGRGNTIVDPNRRNEAKASGASSAAQRRRVLRRRGDDDLLDHFREKLNASAFRLLNEQVYNSPTAFAAQLLRDKDTFTDYHVGYHQQLVQWPINPNQLMIDSLLQDRRGRFLANKAKSMPGYIPPSWVVADMGCGEAQVAAALKPKGYTVHSFDFHALNDLVTVANTTSVPLPSSSVDICIFSLSLMATDYVESLYEAFRVLKPRRLLKIVEVRSRVPWPHKFASMVAEIGFELDFQDVVGDYFVSFDFVKKDNQKEPKKDLSQAPGDVLVPSMYKKR